MNPVADTKDLALPSPTSVAGDLSGHSTSLGFGRRYSEIPESERKLKDILLATTKNHLTADHFCN